MKTKIIAVANNKGGVGKTTTAVALAAGLSRKGYKVLAVDMDTQANLTYSISAADYSKGLTIADTLFYGKPLPIYTIREGLDIVPASFTLSEAEVRLSDLDTLSRAIAALSGRYDFVVIDTAPGVGKLTLNAIKAATDVVLTLTAEALPTKGMENLEGIVGELGRNIAGYLFTRYNSRLTLSKEVEAAIRKRLGTAVFNTIIRENVALAEAPFSRRDIFAYAPKSNGAKDYAAFVEELLNRIK